MLKNPIEITLYDDDGKPNKTYKLCIIPWKMMKKITTMFAKNDATDANSESKVFEEMTGFICELYHNQFTADDLDEHGSAEEVMAVINQVMEEMGMSNPNVAKGQPKAAPKN